MITDLGDPHTIHLLNKQDVGKRLALIAQTRIYGKSVAHSGPVFKSAALEAGSVRIKYDHMGGGLVVNGDKLDGFALAGSDKKWVWPTPRSMATTCWWRRRRSRSPSTCATTSSMCSGIASGTKPVCPRLRSMPRSGSEWCVMTGNSCPSIPRAVQDGTFVNPRGQRPARRKTSPGTLLARPVRHAGQRANTNHARYIDRLQAEVIGSILRHCGLWQPSAPPAGNGLVPDPDSDLDSQTASSDERRELTGVDIDTFLAAF